MLRQEAETSQVSQRQVRLTELIGKGLTEARSFRVKTSLVTKFQGFTMAIDMRGEHQLAVGPVVLGCHCDCDRAPFYADGIKLPVKVIDACGLQ